MISEIHYSKIFNKKYFLFDYIIKFNNILDK